MADIDRQIALDAALRLHSENPLDLTAIRRTADALAAWLGGTTRIRLTRGQPADEDSNPGEPTPGGNMQLNTGQKVTYTVDTEDASGYDTTEAVEWSIEDEGVAALTVSEDGRSATVVSGAPGSTVLTARVTGLDLEVTEAIDIVPAGTATIKLVAGEVEEENAGQGEDA